MPVSPIFRSRMFKHSYALKTATIKAELYLATSAQDC